MDTKSFHLAKNAKNKLVILSAIIPCVLTVVRIKLIQFGYIHIAAGIYVIYHILVIGIFIELVRSIYTSGRLFVKILKSLIYIPILAFFMVVTFYLFVPVLANSIFKYGPADKVLTNDAMRSKFTALSEELIKRNNITWIGLDIDNGGFSDFIVVYPDGYYLFRDSDIKGKSLQEPITTIKLEEEDLYPHVDSGTSAKKILDEDTYAFYKRVGVAIRRVGIDRVIYSPKEKIVQFETYLPVGMDASSIKTFYYSKSGVFQREYKKPKQVNPNWYSNVW